MSIGKYSTKEDIREIYTHLHEFYVKIHTSMLMVEQNRLGDEIERLDLSIRRTLIYLSEVLEDEGKAYQEEPYHVGEVSYYYDKKEGQDCCTCKKEHPKV